MDLEMTFQLARDLMAATSIEAIQERTVTFIERKLGQPAAVAVRNAQGHYTVVASDELDSASVTERLRNCVSGLPRFEYQNESTGGVANFQPDSTTIVSQSGPQPDLLMMSFTLPGFRSNFREMDSLASLVSEAMSNFKKFSELEMASNIDTLTNLPNRRSLMQTFEAECERARRYGQPLSVLFIDIDKFKPINDQYGHAAGDEALKLLARTMRSTMRTSDIVARLAGDEFIALLPGSTKEDADHAAERLREAISQTTLLHQGVSIKLQISVGITEYELGEEPDDILERADHAMYEDKRRRKQERDTVATKVVNLTVPQLLPNLRRQAARLEERLEQSI